MIANINTKLIEKILALPEAPLLINKLNKAFELEKQKRIDFYENISEIHKSEFINGEVIVHSPVIKEHNEVNGNLYKIIDTYVVDRDLGFVGIEKLLIKLTRNDYEPDLCFFKQEKAKAFQKGQKFFPAPDLIVEVLSKSTAKRDRGIKFKDYQQHQVTEYWLIDPEKMVLEQYILRNGKYELELKSQTGEMTCSVIAGLTIPIKVIFDKKATNQFIRGL